MDITKMDAGQLRDALFDKMAEEQENYQSWLTTLPPDKILDHAAEFTVREDILVEMEVLELPAEQAAALLASPTPLADVYREWGKVETHHMEDIRDVIENCTEEFEAASPAGAGPGDAAQALRAGAVTAWILCAVSVAFRGQKWYNIHIKLCCGMGRALWQTKIF